MSSTISPRKAPRQARSQATVDAILDATARVLVERGYASTSTNAVAAVAGPETPPPSVREAMS